MISIILPWVREDGYSRCVSAVFDSVETGTTFEIVAEKDVDLIGCNPMVNRLVEKAKYDIICFLHDDSEPQRRFLENAIEVMEDFPDGWGCVGFNDLIHNSDGPCTHWMIHKKMLRYFPDGVFYSEDYVHTRVDLELKQVCKAAERYRWAEKAKIRHLNPIHNRDVKRDEVALRCYSRENLRHDAEVYERRRREQGRKWEVAKTRAIHRFAHTQK